jgi:hypothetical protein
MMSEDAPKFSVVVLLVANLLQGPFRFAKGFAFHRRRATQERVLNSVSECQIASAKLSAMVGFAMIAEVYSRGFGYS